MTPKEFAEYGEALQIIEELLEYIDYTNYEIDARRIPKKHDDWIKEITNDKSRIG